jgi:hypothetical protein
MRNIIIALSGVITVLVILMALLMKQKNNMELEMAAIKSKSDSLYDEIVPLKYQNMRYEYIYDQLSTNPEVIKAFNETE